MNLANVRRESKILDDICMVLRWVVAECHKTYTQIFGRLEAARLEDVGANFLDVFRGAGDVGALASCTVLHEHEIAIFVPRTRVSFPLDVEVNETYSILRPSS